MSAPITLVMETQSVTTQLDLSRVCVIEDLLVMDLIARVCVTGAGIRLCRKLLYII